MLRLLELVEERRIDIFKGGGIGVDNISIISFNY